MRSKRSRFGTTGGAIGWSNWICSHNLSAKVNSPTWENFTDPSAPFPLGFNVAFEDGRVWAGHNFYGYDKPVLESWVERLWGRRPRIGTIFDTMLAALAIDPRSVPALVQSARTLEELGEVDAARARLERAAALEPEREDLRRALEDL